MQFMILKIIMRFICNVLKEQKNILPIIMGLIVLH